MSITACAARAAGGVGVDLQRLAQDVGDLLARVERAIGVLEHDLHGAAQPARGGGVGVLGIGAVELEPAGAGRLDQGDEAGERALAAAGFAHHRQRAAAVEGEADAAQRLDLAGRLEQAAADAVAALEPLGDSDPLAGHAARPAWPGCPSGTPPVSG